MTLTYQQQYAIIPTDKKTEARNDINVDIDAWSGDVYNYVAVWIRSN